MISHLIIVYWYLYGNGQNVCVFLAMARLDEIPESGEGRKDEAMWCGG
jgi:hypothetical protein